MTRLNDFTVVHNYSDHRPCQIEKVVLAYICPLADGTRTVEVTPEELPAYFTVYGSLRDQNDVPLTLSGVRISPHPEVVSYAGFYWRDGQDGKVARISIYIGVSRVPGLTLVKK